jgi:nicotinate-nucleotide pyrophosphorylase (carboxylating)
MNMANRKILVKKCYDRGHLLALKNKIYQKTAGNFIKEMLESDLGKSGDLTTNSLLEKDFKAKAIVKAKENGVLAGTEEFAWIYEKNGLKIKKLKKDGNFVFKGDIILEITGSAKNLLEIERTGLNILQRMSGIATLTKKFVDEARKCNKNVQISATRKTPLGLLDNKAVYLGGGFTHRLGLWDAILIKNNHLKILEKNPIKTAIDRSWSKRKSAVFIEIEVKNKNEAMKAAGKFKKLQLKNKGSKPCILMFDNMEPKQIKEIIYDLKKNGFYDHVLLEASGGINLKNIKEYAASGVDVISLGYLTHSAKALDLSQEIIV